MSAQAHRLIEEITHEQMLLRASMAELAQDWLDVTASWIADDWRTATERAVRSDPVRIRELAAASDLSHVKGELEKLLDAAPQLVNDILGGDPNIWAHIDGRIFTVPGVPGIANTRSYMTAGNASPEAFDFGIRVLKGQVYVLLSEYRLGRALDRSQWKEIDGRLRYPFSVTWSADMQSRLARYSDAYRRSVELAEELAAAGAAAAADEAQALWDQA